jgi:type II secretory pathway pseudopilin PulG
MPSRHPVVNPAPCRSHESGYVLLTLIFFVAVLAISLATILPSIRQEILRDREEEMIHRGTQYTRAIRLYFKKNGRYPAKIEDLENTNNLRFLRKRYKDPTVKGEDSAPEADFKILRFGDPSVHLTVGGQVPTGQGQQGLAGADPNAAVSSKGRNRALSPGADPTTPQPDASDPNQNGGPNQNPDTPAPDANGNPAPATGQTTGDTTAAGANPTDSSKPGDNPLYGGGAMVGVASTNTNQSYPAIREFNKKHHYNEWQFMYDPQADRGGLPNGPWQPATFPGQAGAQKPVGTPADQISNPVGQPAGNNDANPAPNGPPQQ